MELFAQELKVWKECVLLREDVGADGDVKEEEEEDKEKLEVEGSEEGGDGNGDVKEEEEEEMGKLENCKVPGAFEW